MKKVIVLGGGIAGLSAAWRVGLLKGYSVALHEKKGVIGGLCGCYDFDGMRLDYGPHKIYSPLPGIMDTFKSVGAGRLKEVRRKHKIILRGKLLNYPVELSQVLSIFKPYELIELCLSVAGTMLAHPFSAKPESFKDYCTGVFGSKIYRTVFEPMAMKVWGDPAGLSTDIARKRIPADNIYDLILRTLKLKHESKTTSAETILYPSRGFYDICDAVAGELYKASHSVRLNSAPTGIRVRNDRIESVVFGDREEPCDLVISSIPADELVLLLFGKEKAAEGGIDFAKMRHCMITYLLVNRARVLDEHWIFCADKDLIFSRISEQKLLSDAGFPPDKTVICCDFTCDDDSPVWSAPDKDVIESCTSDLAKLGFIDGGAVTAGRVVRIPSFYPSYKIGYGAKRKNLLEKINRIENVICTGRLGMVDYCNIDHCMDMALFMAGGIAEGKDPPSINRGLIARTDSYRIID